MGKPSIFSKEYERRMKKRRKTLFFIFTIICVFSGIAYFTFNSQLQKNIKDALYAFVNSSKQDAKTNTKDKIEKSVLPAESKPANNEKNDEKSIEVKLPSKTVKLIYEEVEGKKKYKFITPLDKEETFDVSPNSEQVIINDNSQLLLLVNNKGDIIDVTKKSYKKISDGAVVSREVMLKTYNDYIWSKNPKFINDNTVIYISQLPYFGLPNLSTYVWILDLKTQEHKVLYDAKGKNVLLGKINSNGVEVDINGAKGTITADGKFIKNK